MSDRAAAAALLASVATGVAPQTNIPPHPPHTQGWASALINVFALDRAADSPYSVAEAAVRWEALGRVVDAARAWAAGAVQFHSRRDLGSAGLAKRNGFRNAPDYLAFLTGVSRRTARSRLVLAGQIRPEWSLAGEILPGRFPVVGQALYSGSLAVDAAAAVTGQLSQAITQVGSSPEVGEYERVLVDAARRVPSGCELGGIELGGIELGRVELGGVELGRIELGGLQSGGPQLCADRIRATAAEAAGALVTAHDYAFPERREQRLNDTRFLALRDRGDWFEGSLRLTKEQGVVWSNALDAVLKRGDEATRSPQFVDPLTADTRTFGQKRADAATDLIRTALAAEAARLTNGGAPVVNLHVTVADLEAGRGQVWADGLADVLPVSVARRALCHGERVATLLGEHGEILHHGKTRRLFTVKQRRALAVRDGGCVWPHCEQKPAFCEAHHVNDWKHPGYAPGVTDIDNGVLLCPFHHATVHHSEWRLVMQNGVPHVIPPVSIDWEQRPRRCGQRRAGRGYALPRERIHTPHVGGRVSRLSRSESRLPAQTSPVQTLPTSTSLMSAPPQLPVLEKPAPRTFTSPGPAHLSVSEVPWGIPGLTLGVNPGAAPGASHVGSPGASADASRGTPPGRASRGRSQSRAAAGEEPPDA